MGLKTVGREWATNTLCSPCAKLGICTLRAALVTAALFWEPLAWMFGLPSSFSLLWGHSLIMITFIKCANVYKALGKGFTTELVAQTTNLHSGHSHQQWTTPALHLKSKSQNSNCSSEAWSSLWVVTCDGGAWRAAAHGVEKSQIWLNDFTFTFHFSLSCIGEGNGNLLQCSCLETPRDGGAWWAAVYGVAQSWTRLKRLSIAYVCMMQAYGFSSLLCFQVFTYMYIMHLKKYLFGCARS